MNYKCPICGKVVPSGSSTEKGNICIDADYFPFCSERCRLIDLGAWLDEDYQISSEIQAPDSES